MRSDGGSLARLRCATRRNQTQRRQRAETPLSSRGLGSSRSKADAQSFDLAPQGGAVDSHLLCGEGDSPVISPQTVDDLLYMADQAERYDLFFDFEQHEEFKSTEIVQMLKEVDYPRINALFDFTNMINAYEMPLSALRIMAPYTRQAHLKGANILEEGQGYGQVGVVQGSFEDEMPYARMLYELLMLGETKPQVICFVLEQEVNYYSPAYRRLDEGENPFIPYKEPSETPFDEADAAMILLNERRWASNQVFFIKNLLAEMRWLASQYM